MTRSATETVRSFHRSVVLGLGGLDDRFLGRDRPMAESRLLWEVGESGATVRELRLRLGLDSGYMSRLLGALARQRLVEVGVDPSDGRRRRVVLTRTGRDERAELDRRSEALAASLLEHLSPVDRERLVVALADAERLLLRSRTAIHEEPAASADVRWCFGRFYAELDERFESGFDVRRSTRASVADLTPPAGLVLVARLGLEPVGCGALKLHADGIADLKRMWLSPRVRGAGLGKRMLGALEARAIESGMRVIRLETNRALHEAVAMYRGAGYVEVAPFSDEAYADHWFEKRVGPRS